MAIAETRSVTIGEQTYTKLLGILEEQHSDEFSSLEAELDAATIVAEKDIPSDTVAMNSIVTFENLLNQQISTIKLVYPGLSTTEEKAVSVLAPIGAALIGLVEGQTIDWPVPNGNTTQLRVIRVQHDKA